MRFRACIIALAMGLSSSYVYAEPPGANDYEEEDASETVGLEMGEGYHAAISSSMMGWGLGLAIGITILVLLVHHNSSSSHSH